LPTNAAACAFATNTPKGDSNSTGTRSTLAIGIAAGLAGCFTLAQLGRKPLAEAPPRDNDVKDDEDPQTRLFRLDEINHHNRETKGYWVYRGDRVYDITDWVPNHPGGDVILRAVGGSVEPYWNIFTIHRNKDVYEILEQYFIGKILPPNQFFYFPSLSPPTSENFSR
jgi:cytochrome b involved in lipid metabolism